MSLKNSKYLYIEDILATEHRRENDLLVLIFLFVYICCVYCGVCFLIGSKNVRYDIIKKTKQQALFVN